MRPQRPFLLPALLCGLLFAAAAAGPAQAQQLRQKQPDSRPTIVGLGVTGCVDQGDRLTVRGANLGRAGGRALAMRDPNVTVDLPVSNWTDRSIAATVPRDRRLIPGKWYVVGIRETRSGQWLSEQGRPLQICPAKSAGIEGGAGSAEVRPDPRKPDPRQPRPQAERTQPQAPTPPGAVPPAPQQPPAPPPPAVPVADADDRLPDEVLATTADLADATALGQQAANLGYTVRALQELPALGFALLRLGIPAGQDVPTALAALRQAFPTTLFDANALYEPQSAQQAAAQQAAAQQVAAEPRHYAQDLIGWPAAGCTAASEIGLIDTVVDTAHAAFTGRSVTTRSFITAGATPAPPDHGTAVAAILVGAPESRAGGLLPAAHLYAAAIFALKEDDRIVGTTDAIARSVDWLGRSGVRVVNLSLSGPGNQVLRLTAERAAANGMLLVAAAGNEGPNAAPVFPAGYAPVMAVTAIDAALQPYRAANRGDYIDLAAPGVDVWSARGGAGGRYNSGTSFAAPYVTAAAALVLNGAPDASPAAIRGALQQGARDLGAPGRDSVFGWGLLQPPSGC